MCSSLQSPRDTLLFVALLDTDGTVLHVCPASTWAVSLPLETSTGIAVWDWPWWSHSPNEKDRLRQAIERACREEGHRCFVEARVDGNQRLPLDLAVQPVKREIGTLLMIYGFGSGEVGRDKAAEDLERLLYGASHDFQEPLRMIHGYSQLIIARYGPLLDDEGRRLLGIVADAARRMSHLTRALLSFAGTEELDLHPTDTGKCLEDALSNLRIAIEETGAVITFDHLPTALAHPTELTQVFQNLLGNAIKYRKPSQAPRVHVSASREGPFCRFTVMDEGVGFDPGQAEAVFGLFVRLQGVAQAGFGLGLALCRRIISRMGGRIWGESDPGVGASFHFTLRAPEDPAGELPTS